MDSRNQDTKLHDALADFERCLHTPVVPGEMGPWLKRATSSFRAVEIVVRRQIEETHSDLLAEIRGEDLGLAARVDALREGDQELCEMMESTRRQLDRLNASVENVEPDEQRLDEEMRTVVDLGQAFVQRARKQEAAITTWFQESLHRDRGIVD